tara:strand:+ start:112 stop:453 length:342 start_codon:yes stop_codon:yes gene_type:complete
MSKLADSKIKKYIPENIISTLSYVDADTFPYNLPSVSTKEMLRILAVFLRTGKTFSQIKNDLVDIADGKTNELSDFVSTYPRNNSNILVERLLVFFLGVFLAFGLFKGTLTAI